MKFHPVIFLIAAGVGPILAQGRTPIEPASLPAPDQAVKPVEPVVEKLAGNRFRVGKVTFEEKSREIQFPAKVNMSEGLLEFLVVHENGKLHESLLVTDISPTHLNLAFTLLRYPASRELYALPNETGGTSGSFPEVPEAVKSAARIRIDVQWDDQGRIRRVPVSDWIQHANKATAMPSGPWVYGGSEFHDGKYVPEITGDIIAIFVSGAALINYPGDDNFDDTVWLSFPKRVPEQGTNVTVIIAPYSSINSSPTP